MTDQCNNCQLKGDLKGCESTECFHHENWYAIQINSEREELKKKLSKAERSRDACKDAYLKSEQENAKLRVKVFRSFNDEECWIWQGDGSDHLESLVCPVVIHPIDLQQLIGKGWIDASRELPPEGTEVICFLPETKTDAGSIVPARQLMGRIISYREGERSGRIDLNRVHDKCFNLNQGGTFWAFPFICHQNFVSKWRYKDEDPV